MHITCLLAFAEFMVSARQSWHGTIVLIFQPAEERGTGAQSMVDDGLYDPERHKIPIPDEVHPSEHAVVTCASFISGSTTAENVVSDDATITIDIRANDKTTRQKLYNGVLRIVNAESAASNAVVEPTITPTRSFPVTYNNASVTERVGKVFRDHFRPMKVVLQTTLSLDLVKKFAPSRLLLKDLLFYSPMVVRLPRNFDLAQKEGTLAESIPGNHSSLFAPQIFPTMQIGIDAYALSALAWLSKEQEDNWSSLGG
ncbi:uncharacterized protein EAF01_009136 [Botrytis porri]|uniref:uncharacterized protein n=1 Tax=Botrytis porri TaxID=87229 RepID=UPI0019001B00|nr:uncharacterized protein EAF01_009136 [Botrytis porri]KAF7896733.1 hypothetical protein EAF01_009136 [Botrytis porri]